MEETLISFKTAKLAKKKGFDEPVLDFYYKGKHQGVVWDDGHRRVNDKSGEFYSEDACSAPTQSLLQKWLREEHDIHMDINYGVDGKFNFNGYGLCGECFNNDTGFFVEIKPTYEEALEKGLIRALELIKDK